MDPRRLLSLAVLGLLAGGCATPRAEAPATPSPGTDRAASAIPIPAPEPILAPAEPQAAPTPPEPAPQGRPYLADAPPPPRTERRRAGEPLGRPAIAAANQAARAASSADTFVGGVRVFAWSDGRLYDVWTAPLRVTSLTLAPGETVSAKAAGDTVRWQIGESQSGSGPATRTHVLIKPLQSGLETNLVLTTSQRVYLLNLRSGPADAFHAAVAWDYGPDDGIASAPLLSGVTPPPVDVAAVTPQGPLDPRYRIEPRGRAPRWTPIAVFNDSVRTFITLSPETRFDEAPALFVRAGDDLQMVNYRQADGLLIVDRVFDDAELRLGDRRPQVVRIRRISGAPR